MRIESKCLHEGWKPKNGEPHALPIYQSTTYNYDSTEHIGDLFDLKAEGYFYTRLANPTVGYVEEKLAALEGGVGAMCTSSGQSANMIALLNIMGAGDHMVCASEIYGGTINLFSVTLKKLGIECTFVDQDAPDEELEKAFCPNTKLVFGETIANPAISVFDIERFANLAHKHGVPLIVDNTFATPILCRPFEFGADIVTHSTCLLYTSYGIVNGTTNYILTKLDDEGRDFDDVLKEAQELGYAEANPTSDVEGYDARYKLSILASMAFHARVPVDKIYCEGITTVSYTHLDVYKRQVFERFLIICLAQEGKGNAVCAQRGFDAVGNVFFVGNRIEVFKALS